MRTGASYLGQANPRYLEQDLREMQALRLDDVLLAAQENDFLYFPGKLSELPQRARDHGIRPLAIFWGALNLFGGGRSSQFLLEHPAGFQVRRDGSPAPAGCYMNPLCRRRVEEMIDRIAELGFAGYFVDEPTPLRECFCPACCERFAEWTGADLRAASAAQQETFRQRCVVDYVRAISAYCKGNHPQLETMCCLMPHDHQMWQQTAVLPDLDNLGTDLYWVNTDKDVEEMAAPIHALGSLCRQNGKVHHEWLQCWNVTAGREDRILEQGKILLREKPDALYIWAWNAQVGTSEACANPPAAWKRAEQVLRLAKEY
jgi:hypothetical protein